MYKELIGRPVSRVLYPSPRGRTVIIYLRLRLLEASSSQPGDRPGARSPPIWPCSGWGLPCLQCHHRSGELLPPHFALPPINRGGIVSVALSVGLPRLAVSQHPALWSSDFPPQRCRGDHPAYLSTPFQFNIGNDRGQRRYTHQVDTEPIPLYSKQAAQSHRLRRHERPAP